jgi:preprotein translocase subunit SecD
MFALTLQFTRRRAIAAVMAPAALAAFAIASPAAAAASEPAAAAAPGVTSLVYRIDTEEVRTAWLQSVRADVRRILRDERIGHGGVRIADGQVRVTLKDPGKLELTLSRLKTLAQPLPELPSQLAVISEADGRIALEPTLAGMQSRQEGALWRTIQVVRLRLDPGGEIKSTVIADGEDRILVLAAGLDPAEVKARLSTTAKLTFQLAEDSMTAEEAKAGVVPPGDELVPDATRPGRLHLLHKEPAVSGDDLLDVIASEEMRTGEPAVNFEFNAQGAAAFARLTRENIGKPFAIVLDGKVISAPVIRSEIPAGRGQITGIFTRKEADRLAILLRSGALPVPLILVEERFAPSSGEDPPDARGNEGK